MRFTISTKDKVKQFNDIIKKMQKISPEVNFVFDKNGLYAQGMNSSHVIIFELKLRKEWFDKYEGTVTVVMGLSCVAMEIVHKCHLEGQNIKWSFYHDSTEELLVYFEGSGFDTEFEIKLLDIDTPTLNIPEMEYDADLVLNSHDWGKIIGQMEKFGDKTEIEMGVDDENTIFIRTNGDMGKSTAKIKQDQLQEFAIEENTQIKIEFGTKFLLLMSEFSSLNTICNLHFQKNFPMKMSLSLDHWMDDEEEEEEEIKSFLKFYLAPCINEDEDEID